MNTKLREYNAKIIIRMLLRGDNFLTILVHHRCPGALLGFDPIIKLLPFNRLFSREKIEHYKNNDDDDDDDDTRCHAKLVRDKHATSN